jgi:hypothetical protein
MTENAYPLAWPPGWKRTTGGRKRGQFVNRQGTQQIRRITAGDGAMRVLVELERLHVERHEVVISTNLKLRTDGLPREDMTTNDPGAAVYWRSKAGARRCMAVDAYDRTADNLAAIAATLEALRAIERHGGAAILDRAFTGFAALPAPAANEKAWHELLDVLPTATEAEITAAYRRKISEVHSGRPGGDHDKAVALNLARDQGVAAAAARC